MPAGRPTDYREEYCDTAVDFMAQGYSKEALAGKLGVTKKTLYTWIDKHESTLTSQRFVKIVKNLSKNGSMVTN